jgi:hypothetical protein
MVGVRGFGAWSIPANARHPLPTLSLKGEDFRRLYADTT